MENSIELKAVKDILGMNFFIPSYQRGYRWKEQQVIDLLNDIYSFSQKHLDQSEEIYCIQPLVVAQRNEDILAKCKLPETTLDDIRKYIKGSWTVVDGQQRLTTIYLVLKALGEDKGFEINYSTRLKSGVFLKNIKKEESSDNIDFFHMYNAYSTIVDWIKDPEKNIEAFRSALLNRVNFIWYEVDQKEEIKVFQRLNIGKIPLTDSELIKALFLNRTNFCTKNEKYDKEIESLQKTIAFEWDMIERDLQNDEFWAFINNFDYPKQTRIDYILDKICSNNDYKLNEEGKKRIGKDEHKTFRYFNEVFAQKKNEENTAWIKDLWSKIKMYYQVFSEWYHDYRLYHYIGYLSSLSSDTFDISIYVSEWNKKDKKSFLEYLKTEIKLKLKSKKWLSSLNDYQFDQEGGASKRDCVDLLLLHNIETVIQQNDKLISDSKYNLPNFSKFPFHLFKKEKWEVEHIRPNAGDDTEGDSEKKMYFLLAKPYMEANEALYKKIESYLENENNDESIFFEIREEIYREGGVLADEDKNKIWNYTLLDAKTNKEYGNQIFPVKRDFINNKVNGIKKKYKLEGGKLKEQEVSKEVAFLPICTQKVFSKSYTSMPTTMVNWNKKDAEAYLNDIKEKLKDYLPENLYGTEQEE